MAKQTGAKKTTSADLDLLAELGVKVAPAQVAKRSPEEARIIAGFEEIERFVEEQGRAPQHGEERDIFERLYAVRLDRLRDAEECRELLKPLDSRGLLDADMDTYLNGVEDLTDEALLASLGLDATSLDAARVNAADDITQLTHVRSRREIKAAEEVARRTPCRDFDQYKPLFENVQCELETGARQTVKYQDNAAVNQDDLFILDGQKIIVADMGKQFTNDYGRPDRRLRVIYDNGTESDLLLRSLQRALNKDKASRRITKTDLGPLFADIDAVSEAEDEVEPLFSDKETADDLPRGTIYVLRSKSGHPFIAEHRSVIHKIGVTGGDVKARIANAKKDPTYLLADVEIVATFKLANINPKKFEALLQKFFSSARLDLELTDRFDIPVKPKEWFLVPLEVIEEVIEKITVGSIGQFQYDPETATLSRL